MKDKIIIGVLLAVLIGLLFFGESKLESLKQLQADKDIAEKEIVALRKRMASQNAFIDSLQLVKERSDTTINKLNEQIADLNKFYNDKIDSLSTLTFNQQIELFNYYTGNVEQDTLVKVESQRIANANVLFVEGDKCKDELRLSKDVVEEREKQVVSLEGIVKAKDNLIALHDAETKVRMQQLESCEGIIKQQVKQIKKERRKTKFVTILSTGIIILLAL